MELVMAISHSTICVYVRCPNVTKCKGQEEDKKAQETG